MKNPTTVPLARDRRMAPTVHKININHQRTIQQVFGALTTPISLLACGILTKLKRHKLIYETLYEIININAYVIFTFADTGPFR